MIDDLTYPISDANQIDDRVEIILRELELSIRWSRPCILFAVYSSEYVRVDIQSEFENHLFDLGQKTFHINIRERQNQNIFQIIGKHSRAENQVFIIEGLRWGIGENENLLEDLNNRHDYLIENNIRVLFWLTQNEIMKIAHYAPNLWGQRNRVIEFSESPKGDHALQRTLEFAWQGTGEYDDHLDDTDEKILLRESLLTDLPQGSEANSIRANLLLTLGILHWRKGDFEKAEALIDEAANLAVKIDNKWLEAECLNARALVFSSVDRVDDAIDSYKQAIRLLPDQIFAWNNLGNLCIKIGRNDEAIVTFSKAIECNPEDSIAWNGLGNVYKNIGYFDDAVNAYRKSIQYTPSFTQPWNGLGDVFSIMGRMEEAARAYQQAIQINKNYLAPWLGLGGLHIKQEKFRDAIKVFQRALVIDGKNSRIWNSLGIAQMKCTDLGGAERSFRKAIEVDRVSGISYSNLGLVCAQQKKHDEAIALLQQAVEILDDKLERSIAWNRLGDIYRQINKYDLAMRAYQMADLKNLEAEPPIENMNAPQPGGHVNQDQGTSGETVTGNPGGKAADDLPARDPLAENKGLNPEAIEAGVNPHVVDPPSWIIDKEAQHRNEKMAENTAHKYLKGENIMTDEPDEQFETSLEGNVVAAINNDESTADAIAWNEMGNEQFRRGNYSEAIVSYNKAVQKMPGFGLPYANMGLISLLQGRYSEATLLYQKGIQLLNSDMDKAIAYNGLGNAYRGLNEYDNAILAFRKAAELDPQTAGLRESVDIFQFDNLPQSSGFWIELGNAFLKNGSHNEAITAFSKAAEIDPSDGWAHCDLGRTLASSGRHTEAIPEFLKGIELLENDKDKAACWNRLGNTYRKLNDYDKAIEAFQKAVLLNDEGVNLVTRARFSLLSNCYAD